MAIVFSAKVFSGTLTVGGVAYYTDPAHDLALGSAEKFCFQVRTSNVSGTSPTIELDFITSDDGVDWAARSSPMQGLAITEGGVLVRYDLGTSTICGRLGRLQLYLSGTNPKAFVEVWVTGRDAH